MKSFTKDPYAYKDYTFEWGDWLGTDILSSVTIECETGLTLDKITFTSTSAKVWVAGGTEGSSLIVSCKIETTNGRRDKKSAIFHIKEE